MAFQATSLAQFHHSACLLPSSDSSPRRKVVRTKSYKISAIVATSPSSGSFDRTYGGQLEHRVKRSEDGKEKIQYKKRVFLLDVNPLCYAGSKPSLQSFGHWISLFFSQVNLSDPVIAVFDGEGGNQMRRKLLPSYKAHRRKFIAQPSASKFFRNHVGRSQVMF